MRCLFTPAGFAQKVLPFIIAMLVAGHLLPAHAQSTPASALEATLDPGEKFRDGISLVWSPVGNAVWSDLLDFHKVEKIHMNPRSVTAEKLNAFPLDKSKVLPPVTLTFAGEDSPAYRVQLRDSLRKHAGEGAASMIGPYVPPRVTPGNPPMLRSQSTILVSSLAVTPRFPTHFAPDATPRLFTNKKGQSYPSLGFGTAGRYANGYADSVRVLSDNLAGHHALRLEFFSPDEKNRQFLVLSTQGDHASLEAALKELHQMVMKVREPSWPVEKDQVRYRYTSSLEAGDELWIPYLKASVFTAFPDLMHKRYLESPDGRSWWDIGEASQLISLRLDHEGAMLQTTVQVVAAPSDPFGDAPAQAPTAERMLPRFVKKFVFNRPFIASLWREGADWPYLACWVDGPELLSVVK